jgi:hypothetical protein
MELKRPPPRLSAADAIASIRESTRRGELVFGVEGFEVTDAGFVALLDLIHDTSASPLTHAEAAAQAEAFVSKHARDDVLWEVWTDAS